MPFENPRVESEKPPIPTVWLDTSVFVKLAKIKCGEKLAAVEIERLTTLSEVLQPLVQNHKVLCVRSEQFDEVDAGRLHDEIRDVLIQVSSGIRLQHRQGIRDHHVQLAMKAYIEQADAIRLPYLSYFHRDPMTELEESKRCGFIVDVSGRSPFLVEQGNQTKRDIHVAWEKLRKEYVAEGRTFDEQLSLERKGPADAMFEMVKEYFENMARGRVDFNGYMGVWGFMLYRTCLEMLAKRTTTFADLHTFMISSYYNNLPFQDIGCKLCTDLIVRPRPVKSGDNMDVELLQTVIPLAHYVVADKDMVDRVERLGIASDWNTKIYSMRTIGDLAAELRGFRAAAGA